MAFVARRALGLGQRSFSAAAATAAPSVDWAMLRSKMQTAEGQADADKAKDLFQRRLVSNNTPNFSCEAIEAAEIPCVQAGSFRRHYAPRRRCSPGLLHLCSPSPRVVLTLPRVVPALLIL